MELRVSNRSQLPAQEGLKAKWSTHMPVAFSIHVWRQAQSLQASKEAGAKTQGGATGWAHAIHGMASSGCSTGPGL